MNRRMTFYITGKILRVGTATMLLPMIVALIYGESPMPFIVSMAVGAALSGIMAAKNPENSDIGATDGFIVVALAWVLMSAVGALPFTVSGAVTNYIDAFFETVSGFTTTGSTILSEIESLPKGILFWRSFTHWIGGMGVLVFVLAFVPLSDSRAMHLMRAEVPGPTVGKLVPKMRDTAKILYGIYLAITILMIVLLMLGGLSLFDSSVTAFGTAGTGGYAVKNASIAGYDSPYVEWITTIFMLLFGVNFNLYFFALLRKKQLIAENEEVKWYFGIVFAATALIAVNILPMYDTVGHAVRDAAFQVASIITTTGYGTTDFNLWPEFSRMLLVILMFIGASAGSTGGGIKVSRIVILFKTILRNMKKLISPRIVAHVKMDRKTVDEEVVGSVATYLVCYVIIFVMSVLTISLDGFTFEESFTAVTATLNNIGPGLGCVGSTGNFGGFSWWAKLLLSFDMLVGRLEIYPMLMLIYPAAWRKK
ncbi:MAG: TrkH family potassium uptake protein [Oscillospiraceae bacterium]|nr:TrkH family potassium uptake protein [Oscillospiraceae bacterium]